MMLCSFKSDKLSVISTHMCMHHPNVPRKYHGWQQFCNHVALTIPLHTYIHIMLPILHSYVFKIASHIGHLAMVIAIYWWL